MAAHLSYQQIYDIFHDQSIINANVIIWAKI